MADTKQIWLPVSEMNVTVANGQVQITETMTMRPKPLSTAKTGFGNG